MIKKYNRDTAVKHLGRMLKRRGGEFPPIPVFGVTDDGVFLGTMECGPYISYEWMLDNCEWDDGSPCGVEV